jgi:hypothetical protein
MKRNFFSASILALCLGVLIIVLPATGCKKRDRLSASTFRFSVTPPAASVLLTNTLTLTANGSSAGGHVDVSPNWTVSPSSMGAVVPNVGTTVVFQPAALGDVVVTATYDGMLATSQIAVVSYIPTPATYSVYSDLGLPANTNLFTGGGITVDAAMSSGYTPEGIRYARSSNTTNSQFWGISLNSGSVDLSSYSFLKFDLRLGRELDSGETLIIRVQDASLTYSHPLVSSSDGFNRMDTLWQEISIPVSDFAGIDSHHISVPFIVLVQSVTSPLTFDLDAIRWSN